MSERSHGDTRDIDGSEPDWHQLRRAAASELGSERLSQGFRSGRPLEAAIVTIL